MAFLGRWGLPHNASQQLVRLFTGGLFGVDLGVLARGYRREDVTQACAKVIPSGCQRPGIGPHTAPRRCPVQPLQP